MKATFIYSMRQVITVITNLLFLPTIFIQWIMKYMVNVIMKHHKQVYPCYSGSRSLFYLINISVKSVKTVWQHSIATSFSFTFLKKIDSPCGKTKQQNSHLLFFFFSTKDWTWILEIPDFFSVGWYILDSQNIAVTVVFWQAFDHEH